ncbi:MAG: MFS transporter [Chloroflexota bacterium]|nr:MFS transporter [Chloroflexota bacterium]
MSRRPSGTLPVLPFPLAIGALVLTYWCVDIVWPALPEARRDLDLTRTGYGFVSAAFFGGRLLANLPAAFLVDRHGARTTAALGGLLLLIGSVLAGLAAGQASLLPARALQGVGIAFLVSAGLLSVLRARSSGGAAMTAFNLAAGVGGGFGLVTGGVLTSQLSWRGVFWLAAILGGVLTTGAIVSRPSRTRARPDGDADPPTDDPAGAASDLAEPDADTGTPGFDEERVSRAAFVGPLLANLLVFVNYSIFIVAMPLYAADHFDASAGQISALLLASSTVHLAGAVPGGRAIRRWGGRRALGTGYAAAAIGMLLVLLAPGHWWLILPLALYSLGEVTANSAAGDLLVRLGGRGGRSVGMVRLTSDVGLVVGPAAMGALADVAGVEAPFVALAALSAVAAFVAGPIGVRAGGRPSLVR